MSNPASPKGVEPLSAEDVELLGRAREQRRRESVPVPVRERLFARVLEDAKRAEQSVVVPAGQFVTVQPRGLGFALRWAAAMALGITLLTQVRGWLGGSRPAADDDAAIAGEAPADGSGSAGSGGAASAARQIGSRLFRSALFHAPASAFSAALPAPESSLLGERPFSPESRAWQVWRWDDLKMDPRLPANYELVGGALCVALGESERVVGGWPWVPAGEGTAPKPVRLDAGKSYRLVFRAWAREPLPAQVLIAVGHARAPFSAAAGARVAVSTTAQAFAVNFVAAHDDPSIGVAFLATAADSSDRTRLCLSDVTLTEATSR